MASKWVYTCQKGLRQETCGDERDYDKIARGAGRWAGCPSCAHRVAANTATRQADHYHRTQKKEQPNG